MPKYVHVYRTQYGEMRAIGADNREWRGRKTCLIRTYMIWDDGGLTEIEAFTEPGAVAS